LVLSIALLLFIVLDPFGNMVTLNTLLSTHTPAKRRRIMLRESLIALGILLLCVVGGGSLLSALGLDSYTLGISGGIVLFMIALGMVFPARRVMESEGLDDPLVVPIAMPLIAGPGAISIVTVLAEKNPLPTVVGAVTFAAGAGAAILTLSPTLFTILGRRGALALERLMGILLVMLAVQMVLDGLAAYLAAK
jgi:multiple antibiotic resistance protein